MKKIITLFLVFSLLTLTGCKKCIKYDIELSHFYGMAGKVPVVYSYHRCLGFKEE